jgi:hypothetical protein
MEMEGVSKMKMKKVTWADHFDKFKHEHWNLDFLVIEESNTDTTLGNS